LKIILLLLILSQKNYFQTIPERLHNKLESLQQSYFFDLDGQHIGYKSVLLCKPEIEMYGVIFPNFNFINIRTLGNDLEVLVEEQKSAGKYKADLNASELASGIYFYKLRTTTRFSETKKLTLIK
jgi:hypothetical protein